MGTTRKPTPSMSPKPEKWTWQMAEEALSKNTTNRHVRDADVAKYARLMKDKLWGAATARQGYKASSAPIIFDTDGNLIDGQHRLLAQVMSKTTQYWYVLRDVPPETQQNIDTGIPRTAADALRFAGYQNYIILASVARWAWLLEQGQASSGRIKVANDEIKDMCDRHPDLVHSAAQGAYARTGFISLNPSPLGAAHWWIAQHNDHTEADIFLDRIVRMNREPDGSAILALLKRFTNAREKGEWIPTRIQIAMTIRAWNLDCDRVYVHRLSSKSKTGEFPVPVPKKRVESQEDTFGPLPEAEEIDEDGGIQGDEGIAGEEAS